MGVCCGALLIVAICGGWLGAWSGFLDIGISQGIVAFVWLPVMLLLGWTQNRLHIHFD